MSLCRIFCCKTGSGSRLLARNLRRRPISSEDWLLTFDKTGDQLIALATLQPGWEPNYDGRPPLVATACLGRVVSHTRLEDGRYNILLLGIHRIGIVNELPEDRTFRLADVELLPDRYPQESSSARPVMRRRFTETIDSDDGAFEADILAPEIGDSRFDRDAGNTLRKNGVPISRVLPVEHVGRGHGYDTHGFSLIGK